MRMPSKPMRVRNRRSDHSGKSGMRNPTASGDKSTKVGGRRDKGPEAQKAPMATKPGGRSIRHGRGAMGYHEWGRGTGKGK